MLQNCMLLKQKIVFKINFNDLLKVLFNDSDILF